MKMKQTFSGISVKIAGSFFALALLIVILLSSISYYFSYVMMMKSEEERMLDAVIQAGEYISSYLEKIKLLSDLIAMYPETVLALQESNPRAIEAVAAIVNISANNDPRIKTIAVISKDGFAVTSDSDMAIPLSDDMMEETWYQNALQSKQMPVLTSVRRVDFEADKSDWVISVSHEIVGENQEHLGVVLIDVSYRFIEDYISSLDLGNTGYAYLWDEKGRAVYHPNETIFSEEESLQKRIALPEGQRLFQKDEYILTRTKIAHSNWTLVGISSMDNIKMLQKNLTRTMLVTAFFMVGISIVISLFISRKIGSPLVELQKAMMEVDENWVHLRINPHSSSEVIAVAKAYNTLLDRVKKLTEDIAQKENAKRIFELKALQSQINPHFLYNTLDTILWLAEFGENQKVIEVSKALGEMLRLSLNIDQTLVPLEQELSHVENYLKIQQKRYENQIHYRIEGDDELKSIFVPKLILQPIVENSIYHGIRAKPGGGQIEIYYVKEADDLILMVLDDGIGYEKNRHQKSNHLIKAKLGGIGLNNVDQRIKILHGEEYGLSICQREGGGTIVRYRLRGSYNAGFTEIGKTNAGSKLNP